MKWDNLELGKIAEVLDGFASESNEGVKNPTEVDVIDLKDLKSPI